MHDEGSVTLLSGKGPQERWTPQITEEEGTGKQRAGDELLFFFFLIYFRLCGRAIALLAGS